MRKWKYLTILKMPDHIEKAAKELIDRYGERSIEIAKERVERLKNSGEQTELDMALMVLSELEKFYG